MRLILKLFLITSLIFAYSQITAQEIGIKGGLNFSSLSYKHYSDGFNYKAGYQLGINASLPISDGSSVNLGTNIVQRKFNYNGSPLPHMLVEGVVNRVKNESNRWYLEIPFLVKKEFKIKTTKLYGEIGPYAGIGFGGEYSNRYISMSGETWAEESGDTKWGKSEGEIKRYDFGIALGFGVLVNKLSIGLSYEHGLINILNEGENKAKNKAFMLNCSYTIFSFKK